MARGDPQINIRLGPDRYAILEASVFVHRAGTPTKLIQQCVEEAIDRYAKLPTVQKALEAQREQMAVEGAKLSHLTVARRRSAQDSSV